MPINVCCGTTGKTEIELDISSYVQIPYLRTNYNESNFEEDIDMKNQFKIKTSPNPVDSTEAAPKSSLIISLTIQIQ